MLTLGVKSERLDHALGLTERLIGLGIPPDVGVFLDDERPVTHAQQDDVVLPPGKSA